MSAFFDLDPRLRGRVGPAAPPGLMDQAIRFPGAWATNHPGPCELDGEGVEWCKQQAAGGYTTCLLRCGRPVFIAPETCLERVDLDEISATFHASDLLAEGRDARPVRPGS